MVDGDIDDFAMRSKPPTEQERGKNGRCKKKMVRREKRAR